MADLFAVKENLSVKELRENLDGSIASYLSELLEFLEEEGFIYSYRRQKDDFSPVIALDQHTTDKYIKEASNWTLSNVFSPTRLKRYENSAIRYFSGCIVKIAISRKIEKDAVRDEITPPFSYKSELPDLALEAVSAERMGGYKAIDYDLSRYVLCDYLDGFFRIDYKKKALESDSTAFLERYKSKYEIEDLHVDGLIISMAYQYLMQHGWDPDIFWQYDDAENYGVDIVIHRTYFPATHGSMSRIMTVAEKNVWLARHHIECVLANEIP